MNLPIPQFLKRKSVAVLGPLTIFTVILAACSPGSVFTPAPITGGAVLATGTANIGTPNVTAFFPNDNIKVGTTCVNTGTGGCQGYVSANLSAVPMSMGTTTGPAHLVSSNTGAGGGFLKMDLTDCFVGPCGEGGQAGLAGNAKLYYTSAPKGPMNPALVSYSVKAIDNDNNLATATPTLPPAAAPIKHQPVNASGTPGTQSAPDELQLNICFTPFMGSSCGGTGPVAIPASFSELFTCSEFNLTPTITQTAVGTPIPTGPLRQVCAEINVKSIQNQ